MDRNAAKYGFAIVDQISETKRGARSETRPKFASTARFRLVRGLRIGGERPKKVNRIFVALRYRDGHPHGHRRQHSR